MPRNYILQYWMLQCWMLQGMNPICLHIPWSPVKSAEFCSRVVTSKSLQEADRRRKQTTWKHLVSCRKNTCAWKQEKLLENNLSCFRNFILFLSAFQMLPLDTLSMIFPEKPEEAKSLAFLLNFCISSKVKSWRNNVTVLWFLDTHTLTMQGSLCGWTVNFRPDEVFLYS